MINSFLNKNCEISLKNEIWDKHNLKNSQKENIILAEGYFYKRGKRFKSLKKRYFQLTYEKILYKKNKESSKILGELNYDGLFLEKTIRDKDEIIDFNESHIKYYRYIFILKKNLNNILLFTDDNIVYDLFISILQKKCVITNFHDNYTICKVIGKGNFAKVYLGINIHKNKKVAIKLFKKSKIFENKNNLENLVNEVRIMRSLDHENIIKLEEVYETETSIYLILELLEGGELFHRIPKMLNYDQSDIKTLMKNLLSALVHMHEKGIMHRDIKPDNILLKSNTNDYEIKIADFGLSVFVNSEKFIFQRCGTPGFIAPEIIKYEKGQKFYNEKCDVFSAGLIFYILLEGASPYTSTTCKEILEETITKEIDYQALRKKDHDKLSIDLIEKMLQKDPNLRISASDALSHFYFETQPQSSECIDEVKESIHNYINNYEKKFENNSKDNWLISIGNSIESSIHTPFIYTNNNTFNGKAETMEKISKDSNISFKVENFPLVCRTFSGSKINKNKTSGSNLSLSPVRNSSYSYRNQSKLFEDASNYINLLNNNSNSDNIKINVDESKEEINETEIYSIEIEENKTKRKFEDLWKHDFCNLIKK